jgi:hypothetical protein
MAEMTRGFYESLHRSEGVERMEEVITTIPRKVSTEMNEKL